MRPHKLHGIMVASFALARGLAGCASAGGAGQSGGSANELMAEDFTPDMQVLTLYQAVQRLRPAWLRGRGGQGPRVYVDGVMRGGLEELEALRVDQISGAERMSPADATTRYGTDHGGGVIFVLLRR